MESKQALSEDEARNMLQLLEDYYGEPVLPLRKFCGAITLWMDCIKKNNAEPLLPRGRLSHGYKYFQLLDQIYVDIRKSNLLGRLLYAKEKIRTRMCPLHKGHWDGEAMFFKKCPHLCDGTGWLRESMENGGYTGIVIVKGGDVEVPLFVGKKMRAVMEAAQDVGLDLDAVGSGIARQQSPPPGTKIATGSRVVVRFGK